jgi:ribonuclease P protein component
MISRKNQFPKSTRVHLRNDIAFLFTNGKSINAFPVKAVYKIASPQSNNWLRIAVSVPKRNFKKAVDRNRIKRQIREIFRLNHHPYSERLALLQKGVQLMFIFTGKESPDYAVLQSKIILILQRLLVADEVAVN